ncbi:MAG: UvrD-helicase domain-containing protein, partial [Acidimicrobiia bacterium]
MSEPLTEDEITRLLARTELTTNMFVEAGAGTGKTTLLVSRLVALVVDEERPLGSIAAITFTEKAAAELRDRFRSALVAAGCLEAAEQIDDAQITTIHGFARAILANHAIDAGLPPVFAVLDELAEAVQFDERFDAFIDELYDPDGPCADAVRLFLVLGHNRWAIRSLVRAVDVERHRFDGVTLEPPPSLPDPALLLDTLSKVCAMRYGCRDEADRLAAHLAALEEWLGHLSRAGAAGDRAEQFRLLFAQPKITTKHGKKDNWVDTTSKDDVIEALAHCQASLESIRATVGHHVVATLLPMIVGFVRDGAMARRRAGTLTFADLLVEARRVLADNPRVRRQISDRWPHVLVDEFQDTDDLQIDIITMICSVDDDASLLPWWERTMGGGALFAVGDPKQSIYRFRGADMRLYQRAVDTLGGGELRPLYRNFRTVPGVLAWVNAAVGALFDPDDDGQATFRALEAHRGPAGSGTAVEIVGVEPTDAKIGEVRNIEADELVRSLVSYRTQGLPTVDADGRRLMARYADMAILLPTRTALDAITTALEASEVPYRIESRSLVFSTPEVRTLVAVLRAIDDPGDAIAVVGALRSPAFGCSDAALLRWRVGGGRGVPAPVG